MNSPSVPRAAWRLLAAGVLLSAAACGDQQPVAVQGTARSDVPKTALQAFDCTANIRSAVVNCAPAAPAGGGSRAIIGGQNDYLKLTSSNTGYDAGTQIFSFDVTVQNLLNEALGTANGVAVDPGGIRAFFHTGPTVTSGTGSASVANADGVASITGEDQPYFTYNEILQKDEVSQSHTWQLNVPTTASTVSFKIYIETTVQYLLVINEVMVNPLNPDPNGPGVDTDREWFEVYNAGRLPVQMQGLLIADSAGSGRRPYHRIASLLTVAPGAYVVLGASTNTVSNGGVPVDYSYGGTIALANSVDALKISRLGSVPGDTLTLGRTQYGNAAISAQAGISRELLNPALDNSNMDGSNWGSASDAPFYGTNGRGTPKAQNSVFTP
ncbi:lamin tail domain-containing protein [Longimicrobium terrae]|uniref:LTD domain-containing protein n=1 Tax=Longimicrobium terrae TaxID=1639882 RepID=A0A841H0S0_9BACT|nr:lamin tail domain-containing protein [Longimicrobium terrae]MBB4637287.1 hypothetical protein [Longimicrobium terrae]MBB6071685.1 hypothetical protein [Longimicrobium terrae]NNC28446.1 lamin tail domain-containing protein [Longimicrobium terrae]